MKDNRMSNQALFVDLPNFYSRLLPDLGDERSLRDYFLYWLDFDRVAEALTGEFSPVWVFYSGKRFGPSGNRIEDIYLNKYISRINSLRGVTARDVNIPGQQREPVSYQCEECGHSGKAEWESEKGIDASLTVHLFDTMDTWDAAFLLSGDADFVPVVASLRRRGKIVIGVGFANPAPALVRECYDYIDLSKVFIRDDLAAYRIFKKGGLLESWLTDEVRSSDTAITEPVEISFEWQQSHNNEKMWEYRFNTMEHILSQGDPHYRIFLTARGPVDLTNRFHVIHKFDKEYLNQVEVDPSKGTCNLIVSPVAWQGISRRLNGLIQAYGPLKKWEGTVNGGGYTLHYTYSDQTDKYESSP
jgi:uncharacterized LabA/DUF88 family protein